MFIFIVELCTFKEMILRSFKVTTMCKYLTNMQSAFAIRTKKEPN